MDRRRQTQARTAAAAFSLVAHAALLFALLSLDGRPPPQLELTPPITVELVDLASLIPKPAPAAPAAPAKAVPAHAAPQRQLIKPRPTTTPVRLDTLPSPRDVEPRLSAAQLAGAAVAGSGGGSGGPGGGGCDMAARVQTALREDPLVRTAVAGLGGKAALVWNGDWVRSGREDGKGLAAVREAILWSVGFAPKACRSQPMRGLILMSVDARAGAFRLAVGTATWRWSDLLTPRSATPDEGPSGA